MKRIALALSIALAVIVASSGRSQAEAPSNARYFYAGSGKLAIASAKGGGSFSGTYRRPDGSYDPAAIARIQRIFLANPRDPAAQISPRLIEFIAYLVDTLRPGARVTIASGYRSPTYNTRLRDNGKLAAKASLHQYGMAADLRIDGVSSERAWGFIKELGFGGTGYYHGGLVHVDVGPARSWDETTSGVGTDISEENKLIDLVADRDIYLPGETIDLRFTRMTAFPIGVAPAFTLEAEGRTGAWREAQSITPMPPPGHAGSCPAYGDIVTMMGFRWAIPADLPAGRYRIAAHFCDKAWDAMPASVATPAFEVRRP